MSQNLQKVVEFFHKKEFNLAIFYLSLETEKDPNNEELKVLSLLTNIALKNPDEALMLFKFYEEQKRKDGFNEFDIFGEILNNFEIILSGSHINKELENGISLDDFLRVVEKKKDFKSAFEQVKLSTNLLISSKKDFKIFLDLLMKNNYKEQSLKYASEAFLLYPLDDYFKNLIIKLSKEKDENRS